MTPCPTCGVTVTSHTFEQCARWRAELATLGPKHDPVEWSKRSECEERGHVWRLVVGVPIGCARCGALMEMPR